MRGSRGEGENIIRGILILEGGNIAWGILGGREYYPGNIEGYIIARGGFVPRIREREYYILMWNKLKLKMFVGSRENSRDFFWWKKNTFPISVNATSLMYNYCQPNKGHTPYDHALLYPTTVSQRPPSRVPISQRSVPDNGKTVCHYIQRMSFFVYFFDFSLLLITTPPSLISAPPTKTSSM